MRRRDAFLTLTLLACALAVVYVRDRARLQFMDKDNLDKEARELEVEWGRLQLELGSLTSHTRVDELARKELGLVPVPLDKIILLSAASQANAGARP
jgi:cell division protein FtsL